MWQILGQSDLGLFLRWEQETLSNLEIFRVGVSPDKCQVTGQIQSPLPQVKSPNGWEYVLLSLMPYDSAPPPYISDSCINKIFPEH